MSDAASSPQLVKFIARLVHADTGQPLTDAGYSVRFFDHDLFKDDALGTSALSDKGVAEVICSTASWQTGVLGKLFQRLKEQKPDVFLEVRDASGRVVYVSPIKSVDPLAPDEVTGRVNTTIDLGTYAFRHGEGLMPPEQKYGLGGPMI